MAFGDVLKWVVEKLKTAPELRAFLPPDMVLVGDRKHGDDLQTYEVIVYPSSKGEPRASRTFDSRTIKALGNKNLSHGGTKLVVYRIFLTLFCRETDPDVRLFGAGKSPGILRFTDLVEEVLERDWRFKPTIQALEFESTSFSEGFPPPKADMVLIVEEEAYAEDRRANPAIEVV